MERTLYSCADARGVRYWSLEIDAAHQVITGSGKDPARLRTRAKACADAQAAARHAEKALAGKLKQGFIYRRAVEEVEIGERVLHARFPHSQQHAYFDVHPDGRRLIATSEQRPTNSAAWLHLLEMDTGRRAELLCDEVMWTRASQAFAHCALFLGEAALFAVNGRTWWAPLDGGEARPLATYQAHSHDARFNPHVVWPKRDAGATRALIYDVGDVARVIDASTQAVFEVCQASPTSEVRGGALSPCGGRLALYVASRHIIYGHEDAASDATHEIRVWSINDGAQIATIPVEEQLYGLGFTPDAEEIWGAGRGPIHRFEIATGRRLDDLEGRAWCFSDDGARLALSGRGGIALHRWPEATLERRLESFGVRHWVSSADSRVLYQGKPSGEIIGWRLT